MAVSALLAELLTCKSNLNYNNMQLIFINTKYDQNQTEMARYQKYQTAWEHAYNSAIGNKAVRECNGVAVEVDNQDENKAIMYANAKIKITRDEVEYMLDELTELDNLYDVDKTVLQTHNDELNETVNNLKEQVSTEAKNTEQIN